ncbi:hypothetical protein OESDEN_22064, partial [Oesophagostomum dentatum]
ALAFISVGFAFVDIALNFIFYFRKHAVAPGPEHEPTSQERIVSPSPSILKKKEVSVISTEDLYQPSPRMSAGHSTEV